MKQSIILLTAFFTTIISFGQSSKEKKFHQALKAVVEALSSRDSVALSGYIDKSTGIYILYRPGVFNSFKRVATIGFSDNSYPNVPFYDSVKLTRLMYSPLPSFDCETWTKTGTFVDTTKKDHMLSDIARHLNSEFPNEVPAATIREMHTLENRSRKIVIAENKGNELIIYLSYINNHWVLTIIDKVSADCSS